MRRNRLTGGKRRRTLKHKRKKSHKSRKSHKRRTRVKKRKHRRSRHRGGYSGPGNVILTPATFSPTNAYPPNGAVLIPSPGITKVATRGSEQQYYYAKNNRVMKAPESTNPQKQSGGRKRRRTKKRKHKKRKKRKTRKRKKSRKHRRRRRHRGGGLSNLIGAIPGGPDIRDVLFKSGNVMGSLYSQYNGYGPTNEPPMTNYTAGQPINKSISLTSGDIPMHQYIQDGSLEASKFKAGYN